jgi:hypothetical protein
MSEACINIRFGITNPNEKVRAGHVKAVVCTESRQLHDWLRENGDPSGYPNVQIKLPLGILDEILIIPSQWGKGFATPALMHFIQKCIQHLCNGALLNAVPRRDCPIDLVRWYERHGFRVIGNSGLGKFMLHDFET